MWSKEVEQIDDGFNALMGKSSNLKTLCSILGIGSDDININKLELACVFRALETLAEDLYNDISKLDNDFLEQFKIKIL